MRSRKRDGVKEQSSPIAKRVVVSVGVASFLAARRELGCRYLLFLSKTVPFYGRNYDG
jgi:hypothetical protein